MAVPKKKLSRSRTHKRRSMWKLTAPQWVECPRCHQDRLPHHVCPHCGYYNGRIVVQHDA
ncbi:50S ribosomal protein L32 [Sulfobacillus thermosulfidooxidans]|uniref:Large ribosomal subunit protein bL32 n=2 Tax=Sulfobacillus thermosulfidooxidans TaxID=28034 RepID=A0A1W1WMC9_SULTA|nr:50S ribosomal protein L32 [Sulfobacillus thermosulfidooxidans]PSR29895.1 MAG: 50S ribosomal protein L32 [Sulfobacillus thermosulfidooxidans]SMC07406.1 large subunit ribosomal protein L32 [Sulfobacillus thermosulfidooxidans DSM 9293]